MTVLDHLQELVCRCVELCSSLMSFSIYFSWSEDTVSCITLSNVQDRTLDNEFLAFSSHPPRHFLGFLHGEMDIGEMQGLVF